MIDSRLILFEGMPSTGKTTNARFMQIQLERNGIEAKWIHEIAMPHPILFFDEAVLTHDEYNRFRQDFPQSAAIFNMIADFRNNTVGIPLTPIEWNHMDNIGEDAYQALAAFDAWNFGIDAYKEVALEKWAHFIEKALVNRNAVYMVDSAVFQYQIFTFLFKNRPYGELHGFVNQIINIIKPLNPCLLFLCREDVEASIDYLEETRGTAYLDYIWRRDKGQPYYTGKPPGAEGFKQFLRDYAAMANLLFESFTGRKAAVEITDENWAGREDEMLSFLHVNRMPNPDISPSRGVYVNEASGYTITVDAMFIIDPNSETRPLHIKSSNEFYVDWIPTILRFEDGRIIISGSQTGSRWTTTGFIYNKQITGGS